MKPKRILEISSKWTRFAGRLLVGLGHEVVLVEPPEGILDRAEEAPLNLTHWHAGKKSVILNPNQSPEAWHGLCQQADVVLDGRMPSETGPSSNFGTPTVRVTPFGLTGPSAHRAATDLTIAARGGMLSRVGSPDSPPLRLPQNQAEQLTGVHAAIAVELQLRLPSPEPVDIAAIECIAACLETGTLSLLHCDRVEQRPGRFHPYVPSGLFRTRDGYVGGGLGGNDRMWHDTVEWLTSVGRAGDLANPRWEDRNERLQNREELFAALDEILADWDAEAWAEEAQSRRLPWAVVDTPSRVRDNPQLRARDFFQEVELNGKVVPDIGYGFRLASDKEKRSPVRAPKKGEHDGLLLEDAGTEDPRPGRWAQADAKPLEGVRVLDLTWVLAGPFATRVLADLGAEVIKVESASRPDPTRFNPAMHLSRGDSSDPNSSGYFNEFNRNKRSVTVDTRHEDGIQILRDLIASADVVVENFSATVMTKLGLGWDDLQKIKPSLVYLSMSGMGHTGPRSRWVTYADIVSASGGITALTGWGPEEVVGIIYGHGDIIAGLHGALAVTAALRHRDSTGQGQHIDLSQLEAMTAHMGTSLLELASGREPAPVGNDDPTFAVHGVFRAAGPDDWVAVASLAGPDEQALRQAINVASEDTKTTTAALADWIRIRPPEMAAAALQEAGIAAEVVQDARRLVADPQLHHRQFYREVRHPNGPHLSEASPLTFTSRTNGSVKPAPLLGADTERVLGTLGYSANQIQAFVSKGVLA